MVRRPLSVPLSRASGATPASAAICFPESVPSSGRSPMSVRLTTGPTPGAERSRFSFARQTGCAGSCRRDPDRRRRVGFEPLNVLGNSAADGWRRVLQPILLRDDHLEDLPAARQQGLERGGGVIGQRARHGADTLGKEGQDVELSPANVRFIRFTLSTPMRELKIQGRMRTIGNWESNATRRLMRQTTPLRAEQRARTTC